MLHNTPPTGKVASKLDRAIGLLTFILTISFFTWCNLTHDNQIRVFTLIAGVLYFLTTIGMVTENGFDGGGGAEN